MDEDQYQLMGQAEESLCNQDWPAAAAAFEILLKSNSQNRRYAFGFARALFELKQLAQAQETCAPLTQMPDLTVDELLLLGQIWSGLGHDKQAVEWLQQATRLAPDRHDIWLALGQVWANLSNLESARQCLIKATALTDQTDSELKALSTRLADAADHLSASFVRHLFDEYAENFDQHLTENLRYHVPELLAERAKAWTNQSAQMLNILDLGCGTGLMAQAWGKAPAASWTGIDLSPNMLALARAKNGYQHLIEADLLNGFGQLITLAIDVDSSMAPQAAGGSPARPLPTAPRGAPSQSRRAKGHEADVGAFGIKKKFDLIFASDVFAYVQDLAPVFAAASQHLAKDGQFLFSVEDGVGDEPMLKPSRRYGHPRTWVEKALAFCGFGPIVCEATFLRLDRGEPVKGWLFQTKF